MIWGAARIPLIHCEEPTTLHYADGTAHTAPAPTLFAIRSQITSVAMTSHITEVGSVAMDFDPLVPNSVMDQLVDQLALATTAVEAMRLQMTTAEGVDVSDKDESRSSRVVKESEGSSSVQETGAHSAEKWEEMTTSSTFEEPPATSSEYAGQPFTAITTVPLSAAVLNPVFVQNRFRQEPSRQEPSRQETSRRLTPREETFRRETPRQERSPLGPFPRPLTLSDPVFLHPSHHIPYDTQMFLLNYPSQRDFLTRDSNLRFYKNEMSFQPQGWRIDYFLQGVFGRHTFLEVHHG
jgi:hypothetical protein